MRRTCKVCRNAAQKTDRYRAGDRARSKAYRERNRDKVNADRHRTRRIAGLITPAEYDRMLEDQHGLCAICHTAPIIKPSPNHQRRRVLWVDHDHGTGAVRGLLCHRCNAGLGYFKDRVELLQAAINYLMHQ